MIGEVAVPGKPGDPSLLAWPSGGIKGSAAVWEPGL